MTDLRRGIRLTCIGPQRKWFVYRGFGQRGLVVETTESAPCSPDSCRFLRAVGRVRGAQQQEWHTGCSTGHRAWSPVRDRVIVVSSAIRALGDSIRAREFAERARDQLAAPM